MVCCRLVVIVQIRRLAVVFLLLYKIFNKTHVWSHCKEFSKKKNGRAVYSAAKDYTLGKEHSSIATAAADRIIREATYHGEERNWTYQHYHTKMVEQFQILEEYKELGHHAGLTDKQKVDRSPCSLPNIDCTMTWRFNPI